MKDYEFEKRFWTGLVAFGVLLLLTALIVVPTGCNDPQTPEPSPPDSTRLLPLPIDGPMSPEEMVQYMGNRSRDALPSVVIAQSNPGPDDIVCIDSLNTADFELLVDGYNVTVRCSTNAFMGGWQISVAYDTNAVRLKSVPYTIHRPDIYVTNFWPIHPAQPYVNGTNVFCIWQCFSGGLFGVWPGVYDLYTLHFEPVDPQLPAPVGFSKSFYGATHGSCGCLWSYLVEEYGGATPPTGLYNHQLLSLTGGQGGVPGGDGGTPVFLGCDAGDESVAVTVTNNWMQADSVECISVMDIEVTLDPVEPLTGVECAQTGSTCEVSQNGSLWTLRTVLSEPLELDPIVGGELLWRWDYQPSPPTVVQAPSYMSVAYGEEVPQPAQPAFTFVMPTQMQGDAISLSMETNAAVTSALVTIEYDSTRTWFTGAGLHPDLSGWLLLWNEDPPCDPPCDFDTPGTNKRLRLLFFGGGTRWETGEFGMATIGFVGWGPLGISRACGETHLVQFQPVLQFCWPSWGASQPPRPVKRMPQEWSGP